MWKNGEIIRLDNTVVAHMNQAGAYQLVSGNLIAAYGFNLTLATAKIHIGIKVIDFFPAVFA